VAHRGFVREVDIWARIFDQVLVVTRLTHAPELADDVAYSEENISFHFLPSPDNTDGPAGKAKLLFYAPVWVRHGFRLLTSRDTIMARGPDSIGFLGWLVSRFKNLPRFAKYADQWENFAGEPAGYRLQKLFYRSPSFGGPVMIYGASNSQHPHWVPFFTSGVSKAEWDQAGDLIAKRPSPPPYRLLFVGRFVYFKGIDVLLQALLLLNRKRNDIVLDLVGDGHERTHFQGLIDKHDLRNVTFHGWLGPVELSKRFAQAHVFVHPSRKEGYGKVLVEAMSYGLPIVGADVGVSRELVEKNGCGLIFRSNNAIDLSNQIEALLSSNDLRSRLGENGRCVSRSLLLEDVEQRYRDFTHTHLGHAA
jgi:glycosyltransferase involved in cell wall biosynthesis